MPNDKLLVTEEVARMLRVKPSWVYDHVTRSEPIIPHVKLGSLVRFREEDVERFLARCLVTKATWEQ